MTSLRAADVARKLTSAGALPPVILVFGPDRGLVSEIAETVAALVGQEDPFSAVKLDAALIASDPTRLVDEARTISLFGERRFIWVRDGGTRNLAPAVAPLLAEPPADAVVLIEAGDLRKGTGMRKDVEAARNALAIYCPPDGEAALERMIEEEASQYGLTVDADAKAALSGLLGSDRLASRAEVAKVCLHAAGNAVVTLADVEAVSADIALSAVSEAVEAAFLGQRTNLETLLARVLKDNAPSSVLVIAQRTCHAYEGAAAAVAGGVAPVRAVEAIRPPLYGPRKQVAARVLERWPPQALREASALIAAATFQTRIMPHLAPAVVRDALYRIASHARAPRER